MKMPKKNNKRRIKRRHALSVIALVLLVSVGLMALLALRQAFEEVPNQIQAATVSINFYFRDENGHWSSEPRDIEVDDERAMVEAVLTGLLEGPHTAALLPSIPADIIQGARIRASVDNTLRITFSESFAYIGPFEIIDATSSLVYTLTELDFINQLEFYIGDYPMRDGDGVEIGFRDRTTTRLEEIITPIDIQSTVTVVLYFVDEQMMALVPEERDITLNPLEDNVHAILDALLEGPQTPGLYAIIPEGITYNTVEHMLDTVFVDFPQDFYDALTMGGSALEEMMVFSLVNTLTEQADIRRVQIFIDQAPIQPDEDGNLHMDLSRPIERDESLIEGYPWEDE